jgi:hypothetical protein
LPLMVLTDPSFLNTEHISVPKQTLVKCLIPTPQKRAETQTTYLQAMFENNQALTVKQLSTSK